MFRSSALDKIIFELYCAFEDAFPKESTTFTSQDSVLKIINPEFELYRSLSAAFVMNKQPLDIFRNQLITFSAPHFSYAQNKPVTLECMGISSTKNNPLYAMGLNYLMRWKM